MISSDKNVDKLRKHDPMLRMSAIVLFKSPLQAWYSNYRKLSLDSGMSPQADINVFMDSWIRNYSELLHKFDCEGTKVFLSFDDFCLNPKWHFRQICKLFELEYDAKVMRKEVGSQHYFGGNLIFNQKVESDSFRFKIRKLDDVELPDADVAIIESNMEMQSIYQQLIERYWQNFEVASSKPSKAVAA